MAVSKARKLEHAAGQLLSALEPPDAAVTPGRHQHLVIPLPLLRQDERRTFPQRQGPNKPAQQSSA